MKRWFLTLTSVINVLVLTLILIINVLAMYTALVVAPPEEHLGEIYRILYIHVPSAWVSYIAFGVALITSLFFLVRRSAAFDVLAYSAVCIGIAYIAAALVTGAIWANVAWGVYWNWDPRQTATLVLWLAYIGYLALRASIPSPEKKRVVSAAYAVAAFFTVPMSYFSAVLLRTLHPLISTGPAEGFKLTRPMVETLIFNVLAATCLYAYIQLVLFKLELQEDQMRREDV